MARQKIAKLYDGRPSVSTTFDELAEVLAMDSYVENQYGMYPEVKMWRYDKGGSADSMAHNIQQSKIRLPDEEGGEMGVWNARVERVTPGVANKNGPAWVIVKYMGMGEGEF